MQKTNNYHAIILLIALDTEFMLYLFGGILLYQQGFTLIYIVLLMLVIAFGIRAIIVAQLFIVAWLFRGKRPVDMQIGPLSTIRLVIVEYILMLLTYFVLFPLEWWLGRREPPTATRSQDTPILLVHGLLCNGAYWLPLQKYLQQRGITNLFTLNLQPNFANIDVYAGQVAKRVEYILKTTGANKVILIGHSMGGLVARAYVQHFGGQNFVAKLITLGSPHHGTYHAYLLWGTNLRQMRPRNEWLMELNTTETQPASVPMVCLYSYHDNMITPPTSAALANAKNIAVAGVGHVEIAFSKPFQELIYQELVDSKNAIKTLCHSRESGNPDQRIII